MTDEQRADSMGYEGAPWARTPNLDRVALAGTRFSAAYTPSPVCVPARACMLTGRAGSTIGVLNNHHWLNLDDPRFLTWRFAAAGYQVASLGKQHYGCPRRAFDWEGGVVLGERVGYFKYLVPVDEAEAGIVRYDGKSPWLFAGRYPGDVDDTPEMHNVEAALDWVRRRDPSRPYLLRVSFNAPHTPVVTPAPFDTLIDPEAIDLPIDNPEAMEATSRTHREYLMDYAGTQRLTEAQIRRARQCYYGHVAFVDHAFGALLDALEEMGELENTVIAYVSDHGTHLGDYGFFQKQSFWEVSARVPFFLAGPGIRQAADAVSTPVNVGSLLPTLMDLAGIEVPEDVQYPSLAPALRNGMGIDPQPVFSEIDFGIWHYRLGDRCVMIRDGRWKLTLYRDPREPYRFAASEDRVLYDLETDAQERHNLASDPAYAQVMDDLVHKIDEWDRARAVTPPSLIAGYQH
jgi:arylsulfatase A-like enzyme